MMELESRETALIPAVHAPTALCGCELGLAPQTPLLQRAVCLRIALPPTQLSQYRTRHRSDRRFRGVMNAKRRALKAEFSTIQNPDFSLDKRTRGERSTALGADLRADRSNREFARALQPAKRKAL